MPLSAPRSVNSAGESVDRVTEEQAFLRALRVFIGEVSSPKPRDQEKSFLVESVEKSQQEVEGKS
jgi:hypothetical protein